MDNWKQQVAKWVAIDNQIIELKTKISELNDIHNSITDEVLDFVEEHNMSGKTIRIDIRFVASSHTPICSETLIKAFK